MNERRLVEALKRKENWAYEVLYREFAPKIGSIAKSYLNTDDVDDVVQDVFMRIFKGIKKFRGDSKLSTWIYRIAVNVCKDYLQKYKKRNEFLTDFQETDNEDEVYIQPQANEDVLKEVWRSLSAEKVQKALEKLSPEDRLLIKLRDIDGMSYEEIASVLRKPLGTVKSRLHYARKRLGELLKEGEGVEGR
ncbi:RNA polymerase sigma factor [Thermotoga sp. KOL6]|uniref:RNA polymerase sigma factor n=1 Tax=Thermotoga sp. KOL6 TaxID=126741 RepID=UPI000C770476|nr:sigma-70 family RNA polymerase sigma factor [Thermotoga sp. KOL6]PLV60297.1 RNA polymerase subunit sigma-70 [Thermotoga sp. KOL6]